MAKVVKSINDIADLIKDDEFSFSVTKKGLKEVTESVFDAIGYFLEKGEDVKIHPIGTLRIVDKPARTARNPKTGESVQVAAKRVVKFKPSVVLKEKLGK